MARMTWTPPSGSVPSKPFVKIFNSVTVLIPRMPLSGRVPVKVFPKMCRLHTARITWKQLSGTFPWMLTVWLDCAHYPHAYCV
eukprot:2576790-Amphidinium_carterae.1